MSEPQFDPSVYGSSPAASDPAAPDVVNGNGVSLDDLFQEEVDHAEAEEVLRRGLLPNGTYVTAPEKFGPMNVNIERVEEKDDAGTVYGHRTVITLTGRGVATVRLKDEKTGAVTLKEIEGGLRVQVSPDVRRARDFETGEELDKDDSKSKLWAQAVKAFEMDLGEKPKTKGAVVEYLRDCPVRFRMIQVGVATKRNPNPDGEPRNLVIAISPLKRAGGRK